MSASLDLVRAVRILVMPAGRTFLPAEFVSVQAAAAHVAAGTLAVQYAHLSCRNSHQVLNTECVLSEARRSKRQDETRVSCPCYLLLHTWFLSRHGGVLCRIMVEVLKEEPDSKERAGHGMAWHP